MADSDTKRSRWKRLTEGDDPAPGYAPDERPLWLDIATLRFERTDGYLGGVMVGTLYGVLMTLVGVLIGAMIK